MIWPGMGDPYKRKKTIRLLIVTAIVGAVVFFGAQAVTSQLSVNDPLKNCIDDRDTPYRISATLELIVDDVKADIPANIGFEENCQRSLFTLNNDGVIYVEWKEEYPFEIGHFLWTWDFPLRDMDQSKSKMYVNGVYSDDFIHAPLVDGNRYRGEFTSKAFDESEDTDFMPPEL
jgi:hypothetical protein